MQCTVSNLALPCVHKQDTILGRNKGLAASERDVLLKGS